MSNKSNNVAAPNGGTNRERPLTPYSRRFCGQVICLQYFAELIWVSEHAKCRRINFLAAVIKKIMKDIIPNVLSSAVVRTRGVAFHVTLPGAHQAPSAA